MIAAFVILTCLIAILPALVMLDNNLATGLTAAVVAAAMAVVAVTLPSSESRRFTRLLGPLAFLILLIPCIWMLLQVMPTSRRWLVNPVWVSASAALGKPLAGAISLDIGATLLALARYCCVLGAAIIAAAVALNRQRAESLLWLLTAIATLIATGLIGFDLGYLPFSSLESFADHIDAVNIAAIGVVLSCATGVHAYEQFEAAKTRQKSLRTIAMISIAASGIALFICVSAIVICADAALFVTALFGAAIVISTLVIRKWKFGPWGQAGIAAVTAIALVGFFAIVPARRDVDLTIAFSGQDQIASIDRMLSDAKWAGSGAGSFEALLPIYRDTNETTSYETPTVAAAVSIEMGRPFLWISIAIALLGASILFRRALLRGRDYVYSAAGAACIIVFLISAFATAGVPGITAPLMTSIVCGLAFAQSRRGSNGDPKASDRAPSLIEGLSRAGKSTKMPPRIWFSALLGSFAFVLLIQGVWILLAQSYQFHHIRLPTDQKTATVARAEQDKIQQAASLAVVRGDLWAETAFAYAGQIWIDQAMELDASDRSNGEALKNLTQTLRYAPHRGDIWLMFAALADRYKWSDYQPSQLLKMSYYTAPNELALFPLRLNVSLRGKTLSDDTELQDMVRRDITVILTRAPALKPTLVAAYKSASPQGKAFADRVIADIDPSYLSVVRAKFP
jgi:hypothetical protein